MGVIVFWIGIGSLALQAYALTGRPPDLALMRGIGPLTLLIVVLGGAGFGAAELLGRRRLGRAEPLATRVAAGAILVALAGKLVLPPHPPTRAAQLPPHHSQLAA